jgi:hypothetical protein
MAQDPKMVPCSKCGIPVRAKGRGPHEAKCTGDPERTKALEGRRERTRGSASGAEARGKRQRQNCGMDLTSLTWEELVALLREARSELDARYHEAVANSPTQIPI